MAFFGLKTYFKNFFLGYFCPPIKVMSKNWVKMASKLVFIGAGRICPPPATWDAFQRLPLVGLNIITWFIWIFSIFNLSFIFQNLHLFQTQDHRKLIRLKVCQALSKVFWALQQIRPNQTNSNLFVTISEKQEQYRYGVLPSSRK